MATAAEEPHGNINWKGTSVCMDIHCACGRMSHVNATMAFAVRCPGCDRVYFLHGHIELIELETMQDAHVIDAE